VALFAIHGVYADAVVVNKSVEFVVPVGIPDLPIIARAIALPSWERGPFSGGPAAERAIKVTV
jgi:hypothetical protein